MSQTRYIIIVGCGRLGGNLANFLNSAGHAVVVIDKREAAFDKLSVDFSGYRVLGDATELSVLKETEVENADYLFAVTTHDSTNLMVAQVAQTILKVPHVIARVFDPLREEIYRDFGVETISPTNLSTRAFLDAVS